MLLQAKIYTTPVVHLYFLNQAQSKQSTNTYRGK